MNQYRKKMAESTYVKVLVRPAARTPKPSWKYEVRNGCFDTRLCFIHSLAVCPYKRAGSGFVAKRYYITFG